MRRAFLLLAFAAPLVYGQGLQSQPGVVLTSKRALLLLDPRIAVAQVVYSFSCSPTGRYLVAVVEVPNPTPMQIGSLPPEPIAKKLVVWDSVTGVARDVLLNKDVRSILTRVDWFPGTDKALVQVSEEKAPAQPSGFGPGEFSSYVKWSLLDAAAAQMREVDKHNLLQTPATAMYAMSPTGRFAVRVRNKPPHLEKESGPIVPGYTTFQTLDANGTWGQETTLTQEYHYSGSTSWSEDGRELQLAVSKPPVGEGSYQALVLRWDPSTGAAVELQAPVASYAPAQSESDITLVREETQLEGPEARAKVVTWWLSSTTETKEPRALVALHAPLARIAAGERFVAYAVDGVLFTRQVIELSLDQFTRMREAAQRTEAINKAKQVALGIMMYAQDWDGQVAGGIDLQSTIGPYVKNESVLQGFTLVWQGGNLFEVKDPAKTVLGYTDGPGGRAVAYVDGHVKWEKSD
jgi:prepilin-type processing-associated H-X9-DG protein